MKQEATMEEESIPTISPNETATKLVQHALRSLKADDKESSLKSLELAFAILSQLTPYLDKTLSKGPPGLQPLLHETFYHDWDGAYAEKKISHPASAHWCAGEYEGAFVMMVAKALGARRVLEIGMFTGTTTLSVLSPLPCLLMELGAACDGVEGAYMLSQVIALEMDQYYKTLATPYFEQAGVKDKVDVRIGLAMDLIGKMKSNGEAPFDLIFIDANKSGYLGYYEAILDAGLLRKGGVILVDNVLYSGYPSTVEMQSEGALAMVKEVGVDVDFTAGIHLHPFNEHVKNDSRVDVIILTLRDGVSWITLK